MARCTATKTGRHKSKEARALCPVCGAGLQAKARVLRSSIPPVAPAGQQVSENIEKGWISTSRTSDWKKHRDDGGPAWVSDHGDSITEEWYLDGEPAHPDPEAPIRIMRSKRTGTVLSAVYAAGSKVCAQGGPNMLVYNEDTGVMEEGSWLSLSSSNYGGALVTLREGVFTVSYASGAPVPVDWITDGARAHSERAAKRSFVRRQFPELAGNESTIDALVDAVDEDKVSFVWSINEDSDAYAIAMMMYPSPE